MNRRALTIGLVARIASAAAMAAAALAWPATAAVGDTTLVSRASGAAGVKGNDDSGEPAVSADGRFVAFTSRATNLGGGASMSVYVRDRQAGTTTLVSRASGVAGAPAGNSSFLPSISADGRYVAFVSLATNLSPADGDAECDVYVRDLHADATILVSRASGAAGAKGNGVCRRPLVFALGAPEISADGRYVAFTSTATNLSPDDGDTAADVYVRDLQADATILVSRASGAVGAKGDGASFLPSLSADGRYVAFASFASNLSPDDGDAGGDVYVRDLQTSTTILVSRASGVSGTKGNGNFPRSTLSCCDLTAFAPSISASGRHVAFTSTATNLSPDDGDAAADVYVRDLHADTTTLASRASGAAGTKGNGSSRFASISGDGSRVAFSSAATSLTADPDNQRQDVFVRDLASDATALASRASGATGAPGDGGSGGVVSVRLIFGEVPEFMWGGPAISADGAIVAFDSASTNLNADDGDDVLDVHLRELGAPPPQPQPSPPDDGVTVRASVSSGPQASEQSFAPSISGDSRYVAFTSDAPNLALGDTNGFSDVFVHDRSTGRTSRVSVASDGAQANGPSFEPAISADGRYVAFASSASNLVPGDTNGRTDVFVHDLGTGETTRVSVRPTGEQNPVHSVDPSISGDGRYVAYQFGSRASTIHDIALIFVRDRATGAEILVGQPDGTGAANGNSFAPAISADGRYVAYYSDADNLVPGDTNGVSDVFVDDLSTRETTRVSVSSAGAQANLSSIQPAISADGRYVAFASHAENLVSGDTNRDRDTFVHDRSTGGTGRVSVRSNGAQGNGDSSDPVISADGRIVAFVSAANTLAPGDRNSLDVFAHDRATGATSLVSVSSAGAAGNGFSFLPAISADGRFVAFTSGADNLVRGDTNEVGDVFVRDREDSLTARVSVGTFGQASADSFRPAISADGRFVAFESIAPDLVAADANGSSDVFMRDLRTGETSRVSVGARGDEASGDSRGAAISADGRFVAFTSDAANLAPGDTNGLSDVFVHDRRRGRTRRVSLSSGETQANGGSESAAISTDGRFVAFVSTADNLVTGDTNNAADVFVHDRSTGGTTRVSVDSAGAQANVASFEPAISADGRYVAFHSFAGLFPGDTNGFLDVFVHDRETGVTERVSVSSAGAQASGGHSLLAAISANGRYVAFQSDAEDLVAGDTNATGDVFVHDRSTGETSRVSLSSAGTQAGLGSAEPAISATGRFVAYSSFAADLVAGDTNGSVDVFVYDRGTGVTRRISVGSGGAQASGDSSRAAVSADGRFVAFDSRAPDLVPDDTNGVDDVFVRGPIG